MLAVATPGAVGAAASGTPSAETVTRIEVRSDVEVSESRIERLLAARVGEPLLPDTLARSLRNLQASGLFSEAEAFVNPSADGVEVTFSVWGRILVTEIRFEGDLEVPERDLREVLRFGEADPLMETRVLHGVYELQAFYQDLGYLDASVRSRPEVDLGAKEAVVVFRVDPGPRFRVRSLSFDGPIGPYESDALLEELRMIPGKPYRERAARADSERLELWLISQDYRSASVGPFEASVDWEVAEVDVRYAIDVGPRFQVEIRGAEQRRLKKQGLLPFLDSQRFDEAILLQSVARIRRYYQERGHFHVQVDWSEDRSEELVHLRITIDPGALYELTEIHFDGNEAVGSAQLRPLMSTSTRRLFSPESGRLVDQTLSEDLRNIESFYRLEGYWDVVVGPAEIAEAGDKLSLTVPIDEGMQRRLVELTIEGEEIIDESDLRRQIPLRAGGPFHPVLLEDATAAIRAFYQSKGFAAVQLASRVEWNEEQTLADVRIRLLEGPRSTVDRVVIRGNRRTDARVIRKVANLQPGEPISTGRLLEAQRALYGMGAFSRVEVQRAPGTPFQGRRDILVEVEEGNRHNLTYGAGYNTEDGFSGLFGYTRSNLFGQGLTSRLDLRAGQRDSLARVLVYHPYLGPLLLPTTGSLFYIEESRESFTSLRQGGQIEIQRVGQHSRTALLFDYRFVELLELEGFDPEDIDRDLQDVQIASLTPNWQLDHRNDPVNPVRGWNTNLQVEYAFPLLGAKEKFLKGFLQYAHHFDLRWLGSIGGSFRLGGIQELRGGEPDPLVPIDPDSGEPYESAFVPISERLFAGGRSTHRAYRRDFLGVCGQTLVPKVNRVVEPTRTADTGPCDEAGDVVPVGGNALVLLNLDYRFPIAGAFGGNLFLDAGNLWATWDTVDLADIKPGIGAGVRYMSPVGPLRLEVGYKLDRESWEDSYVIFFSVGNPY